MAPGHPVCLASRTRASRQSRLLVAPRPAFSNAVANGRHRPHQPVDRARVHARSSPRRGAGGSGVPPGHACFNRRRAMKIAIVLAILLATVAGAAAYGRRTRRGKTLSDWAVGGRSLGTVVFWFMNAGEVYTTFAVLGISGYAWALGAPA